MMIWDLDLAVAGLRQGMVIIWMYPESVKISDLGRRKVLNNLAEQYNKTADDKQKEGLVSPSFQKLCV